MDITYQYSKKDFTDFYKTYYKNGLRKRRLVVFALLLIAICYFSSKPFEWLRFLSGIIASAVVIFSIYYFIPLLKSLIALNKALAKEPAAFEKKKLTTTDEGLLIESESLTKTWNWQSIASANVVGEFIYLILADKRMLLFPKRNFQTDADATNFLGLVQHKIAPLGPTVKPVFRDKKENPSVYWCLACLIPVIGAVAGIILLADGASRYRQKWFILIGLGGIACTFLIFWALSGPLDLGWRKQFVPNARWELKALVKTIEFYKFEHGAYPDSLQQISKELPLTFTSDPTQSSPFRNWGKEQPLFNYRRSGDHYYLFSSGLDGIAGTADDIYPQVSKTDSGKFGLIYK